MSHHPAPPTPNTGFNPYGADCQPGHTLPANPGTPSMLPVGFGLQGGRDSLRPAIPETPTPSMGPNTFGFTHNAFGPVPNQPQWNFPQHGTPCSSSDYERDRVMQDARASADTHLPPTPLSANSSFSERDSSSTSTSTSTSTSSNSNTQDTSNSSSNNTQDTSSGTSESEPATCSSKKRPAEQSPLGRSVSKVARVKERNSVFRYVSLLYDGSK